MEFVGKTVRKEFKGFGVFTGIVQSYDPSSGFFEIVYEDGDSEELDFSEVAALFDGKAEPIQEKPRLGRKPKKRRRMERNPQETRGDSGNNVCENLVRDGETLETKCGTGGVLRESVGVIGNLNRNVNLNDGFVVNVRESGSINENFDINVSLNDGFEETVEKECGSRENLTGDVNLKNLFDLNAGFNLNLNEGFDSGNGVNLNVNFEENLKKKREGIDLNLEVNGDVDENLKGVQLGCSVLENWKRECSFDLNLGVDETKDNTDGECGGQVKEYNYFHEVEDIQKMEICGDVEGTHVHGGVAGETLEEVRVSGDSSLGLIEVIQKEDRAVSGEDFKACDSCEVQVNEGIFELSATLIDGYQGDIGSSYKQGSSRRKRRKHSDNLDLMTERVLRRSTRRGSAQDNVSSTTLCADNDLSLPPAVSAVTKEKLMMSCCERPEEPSILPPKLQLPPSSQNLDLDGIHVLEVFSVYACLRSFSTLLFLSPFELEDFVVALKCKSPSPLFDCIHVSILQTLRKHLEYLSSEGSQSASSCLRSLNWGFLDLITWPIFMVEYLLIHGSRLNPGFDLSRLKLFKSDYYKQLVSVKVEILRCLCDDMIEMEAIRSELNRRSFAAEPGLDFDRNANMEVCKKRRAVMDVSGGSFLTKEVVNDMTDWNSDECCLCKMDGSLLCCDGCPAAYHSKCVGVANDLLPEGDWYCPECAIDRHKHWKKPRKSLRGAELLGIDPHGRLYFSSCGYLLVSDSSEAECSFSYYQRNDLNDVIDVLKTSDPFYRGIVKAIYKQLDIPVGLNGSSGNLDSQNNISSDMLVKGQIPATSTPLAHLASSEMCTVKNETVDERKLQEEFVAGYSGHLDFEASKSLNLLDSTTATEIPHVSAEGSVEMIHMGSGIEKLQRQGPGCSNRLAAFSNQSETPGKSPPLGDCSLAPNSLVIKRENNIAVAAPCHTSSVINTRKEDISRAHYGKGYINYYSFAQTASTVAEEIMRKSSDKINENSIKSDEEIISTQMKVILKNSNQFYWPNTQNLNVDAQKEKCGWCFSCKAPTDDTDCLFKMNVDHVQEGSNSEGVGLLSKRNKKGHLIDVISHILSIEDRLHGLLLGPWLNPHYTKLWRKSVLKAFDVVSVKHLLLTLESNLHRLALSVEWSKHVDSAVMMGSATHIVTASSRASSKHVIGRKRARCSDLESTPSLNAAGGLGICWWRGGRLSRQMFSWKVVPHSLAFKAARQAGRVKIPGILYPESSDFAKRSKYVTWRAAVESSSSIEQLAFQVRELDSNIKWDDIENTHPLSILDKEFRKSARLFKKVIIRRKCLEQEGVKYLLDFGKRKIIPNIVVKHGCMVEESSSERKKYWLTESYVPLHLLKSFEEKRITRKSNKMSSGKLSEVGRVMKKSSKKRGLLYLFSRAERSEYYQCGHCNKDVPIREAVCCQYCNGFFHKRHVRKSAGVIPAECTYTCHRCQDRKVVKIDTKAGKSNKSKGKSNSKSAKVEAQNCRKASTGRRSARLKNSKKSLAVGQPVQSQNNKKVAVVVPLRRSARKVKLMSTQSKKLGGCKKRKQKSRKWTSKKSQKVTSWQKKRTKVYCSYWLNGLLLSRKPDDERVIEFRRKNVFVCSEQLTVNLDQPKCLLFCEAGYASTSNYIACEICGGWFHGDAFGLNMENISKLIGFRCHLCRNRTPPVCPHMLAMRSDGTQLPEAQNNVRIESSEDVCNAAPPPIVANPKQLSHSSEDRQGLSLVDECFHKEGQLGAVLDINKSFALELNLEAENGDLLANKKQNTDAIQISNKDLKPDILTMTKENLMLEDNRITAEGDEVTASSHDEAVAPSCKVDVNVIGTKLASLGCEKARDGMVETMTVLKSPVDGAVVDSVELHPQKFMASGELLDEGTKIV